MFSTVWTIRSLNPFDWGYIEELSNVLYSIDVLRPVVRHQLCRDAVFSKDALNVVITADDVVLVSLLMTGNLLY